MAKKKLYLTQDWIDACGGIEHIENLFKMYGYEVEVILISIGRVMNNYSPD